MDFSTAVGKTLAYSRYFNFPLSPSEIHYWLICSHPVPFSSIKKFLPNLKPKEKKLRETLLKNTRAKEITALNFIKYARFIPGIRLIALTGSVAVNNAKTDDDLDLLIITSAHTLWLIRPLLLLLLSIKFNRRHPGDTPLQTKNAFCPNLWLDTLSLTVPKKRQNIYTAHEVLQIKPLLDRGNTYRSFIRSNSWVKFYLANAYQKFNKVKLLNQNIQIQSKLLSPINFFLFLIQYLYMFPKITTEAVSIHSAFFHKNNLALPLKKLLDSKQL